MCVFYDSRFKRYIAREVAAQVNKKDDEKRIKEETSDVFEWWNNKH